MEINAGQDHCTLKFQEAENEEHLKEQGLDGNPNATKGIHNGPISSDVMPNGDEMSESIPAAGNSHANGSLSPTALPQSTSSAVNSQNQVASPGVTAYPPMMLEPEQAVAEVTGHTGDALQSLRLSMPMQETDLSNQKPSLEMENEERIRLEARRRLEEQLKQYRVQRHKERSHRSTPRNRPFSTLDPELMLHPEALPRADTVAMTKEYSFLRTSVPRGPKLGSLGIPTTAKEKKSRSSRASKIHSLADYKAPEHDGGGETVGGIKTADNTMGSIQSTISSVSSVSEVSVMSQSVTCVGEGRSGVLLQVGENVPEVDGGESGARPGNDGNDSDSSSYSSASTRGTYTMFSAAMDRQQGAYTVEGREIAPEAMGQFPSLHEVLQAASDEQHLQQLEQEGTGEPRSRRDSFSSSVSLESSVMGHDEVLQVLKEKMRLEGQLESLSSQANQALKEKTELQAQLATVNAQMQAQKAEVQFSQEKQSVLTSEVSTLRQNCSQLEKAMVELQGNLESKNASLASLCNDLNVAEDQYNRLMGKVDEMQKTLTSKDNTVQEMRLQMGGLQNQLQQVQLERSTLQSRLKTSQAEIDSLQQVRQWYQQQLGLAQEARVRLQSEMANMQAGKMTQTGVLQHLKLENVTLSHQLSESQHRSIKEKERIAVQLQSIEADMMTQEAAYKQIQDAKTMVEDDLQHKLEEFEEERERLIKLANTASNLEMELEQVKLNLSQKDIQLQSLQKEHLELMRQLTITQENLHTKEQSINQLEARYVELEARLVELQAESNSKDDNIQYLQNEKIVLEVALQTARADKSQLDENAERLGEDVLVASDVLDHLKQEVQVKTSQIEKLQQENGSLKKQVQKLKEQFQQQKEKIESLQTALEVVTKSKAMLEKELEEVISLTSTELEEYQEKVLELEDELQESRCFKKRIRKLEDANKKLALELEHEKGKLAGLTQSHSTLREHANILESALAKREADLVQLNLQVQAVLKRKEEEDQQMKQVVQTLQLALEKEKTKVKDLKEQVATEKAEAAHNRRHYRAAMLELSEIKKDLQAKEDLVKALQHEAHKLQSQDEKHSQEISRFQEELAEAHSQLQILQKQLDEELSKKPLTNQEVEDLKWEVQQRQREIETQKQQLEMMGECQHRELDSLQTALQNIKVELETVQEELSVTRKDKFMLQAKVGELKNSMKTILLQNQQLKQDLKQNRLRKQRMELKSEGTPSNPVTPVKIPDCPVPASLLDELLKPSTSVNKEPLNNLHNCLRQLKEEMDSLQKQMEEHTVTVHESMSSWPNTEEGLAQLGLQNNISNALKPLNYTVVESNEEEEQQS
ncbi:golgin subfamily A member 3 isoform X3 [Hippocampus comes]|uniref:golgin subfamily A member 3 isoform X3 n=1 Tax=Hippocampus comes TaxID=109280 RepID=UPI00094E4A94|nr:PREDICTED: golgin subfamily A member 3 isoform X3 [Hippocampus comes]